MMFMLFLVSTTLLLFYSESRFYVFPSRKYFLELLFIPPSIDCYTLLLFITFFFSGDAGICDGLLPSHAGEKETLIGGWMSISFIAYPSLF